MNLFVKTLALCLISHSSCLRLFSDYLPTDIRHLFPWIIESRTPFITKTRKIKSGISVPWAWIRKISKFDCINPIFTHGFIYRGNFVNEPVPKLKITSLSFGFLMINWISAKENGSETFIDVKIKLIWDELNKNSINTGHFTLSGLSLFRAYTLLTKLFLLNFCRIFPEYSKQLRGCNSSL